MTLSRVTMLTKSFTFDAFTTPIPEGKVSNTMFFHFGPAWQRWRFLDLLRLHLLVRIDVKPLLPISLIDVRGQWNSFVWYFSCRLTSRPRPPGTHVHGLKGWSYRCVTRGRLRQAYRFTPCPTKVEARSPWSMTSKLAR